MRSFILVLLGALLCAFSARAGIRNWRVKILGLLGVVGMVYGVALAF